MNLHYLDAVLYGKYPQELREIYGEAWPEFSSEDLAAIREPLDFLGINYYTRSVVRHDDAAFPTRASAVPQAGARITETGWEVHPASLLLLLQEVHAKTGDLPLYITENGAAFPDPPRAPEGGVEDPLRVDYFRTHLSAVREAMARGVPVRGYFAWSLLDNFEWACGFSKRFGIVHVDFATQKRTPKASARFYSEVIRSRGASLDAAPTIQR